MKEDDKNVLNLKPEWAMAIAIAVIMLLTFAYIDLKSLTIWSTNIFDVLVKGDITQYFAYTAENIYGAPHQFVSGTLYSLMPWAIWNFPIWILQYFFKIPILRVPTLLLWSNLFLVVCLIGVIKLVKRIMLEFTKEKNFGDLAAFLTFSSIWIYVGVFYAGQNDIMICLLALIAVYALMKKDTRIFLLASGFAISIKYFFIFPFIALVLLTEKNTLKIIKKIFIGLIPTLLFQIVCQCLPMFLETKQLGPTTDMFYDLFKPGIGEFIGNEISLFIMGMMFVYITSYITIPKEEEYNKFIIYTTFIGWVPLLFTRMQFYRPILIVPFLIILIVQNKKLLKLNLILEILMEIGILLSITFTTEFIWAPQKSAFGIIPTLLNLDNGGLALGEEALKSFPIIQDAIPAFGGIAVAAIIALVIINYPRFKNKYIDLKEEKLERWLLWIRPIAVAICVVLMYLKMI